MVACWSFGALFASKKPLIRRRLTGYPSGDGFHHNHCRGDYFFVRSAQADLRYLRWLSTAARLFGCGSLWWNARHVVETWGVLYSSLVEVAGVEKFVCSRKQALWLGGVHVYLSCEQIEGTSPQYRGDHRQSKNTRHSWKRRATGCDLYIGTVRNKQLWPVDEVFSARRMFEIV